MSTTNYELFRSYSDVDLAKEEAEYLISHGVHCTIAKNTHSFDITMTGGNPQGSEFQILVASENFKKAREILAQLARESLDKVPDDYYLFEFTNEELYDILLNPDEWGEFDYELSKKVLSDRGKSIDDELLEQLRRQRKKILSKPDDSQTPWVAAGYFLVCFGGVVGIALGWYLWRYKKTLPDGTKVFAYIEAHRWHGRNIFFFGFIMLILWSLTPYFWNI